MLCRPDMIYERVGLSVYVACHIFALCPACVNPVIYGYLNENFRRCYKDISVSMQSFREVQHSFDILADAYRVEQKMPAKFSDTCSVRGHT